MTRLVAFVVHNWPLKVAAIVLSTVLYSVFVVTQNTRPLSVSIPIRSDGQLPADMVLLSDLRDVTSVRFFAPDDVTGVDSSSFRATVDLSGIDPKAGSASIEVRLRALDERIQVIDYSPRRINIEFDQFVSRQVPVIVDRGVVPAGLDVRDPVVEPATVTVSGPAGVVRRVDGALALVQIDDSGLDVDRDVELIPVDARREPLRPVEIEPSSARIRIAVLTDSQKRTVPVAPNIIGTPAPGFELAAVTVSPLVITVEGDADQLKALNRADTEPISLSGLTADVDREVELALPAGVLPVGDGPIRVTISLRQVTGSRSLNAGIQLVGARADRTYALSTGQIVVTLGGSMADLDRVNGQAFQVQADVGGLAPGSHEVAITAVLPAGVSLVGASPPRITVTVGVPAASQAPAAPATPAASPAASSSPSP